MNKLKNTINNQIKELLDSGEVRECRDLNVFIKEKAREGIFENYKLAEKALPMHFSGNLDSKIVFIELNPGYGDMYPKISNNSLIMKGFSNFPEQKITDLKTYIEYFKSLGLFKAENREKEGKGVSSFDQKQWHFFHGIELLRLTGIEPNHADTKKIRSEILQLEIVPFMSKRFDFKYFEEKYISERIVKIKEIINACKRDYIFITGNDGNTLNSFDIKKLNQYTVEGRKYKVKLGYKNYNGAKLFSLTTYKALGFSGKAMQNYGKLCKRISLSM